MSLNVPSYEDIARAEELIQPHAYPTLARRSDALSERFKAEIFLKPENMQRTGSFKIRGAVNRVAELAGNGVTSVITASAGNHGQGVAFAANLYGLSATVVVPDVASPVKIAALRRAGVDLKFHGRSFDDAQRHMLDLARETGAAIVSPYDAAVVAGQGTTALELLHEVSDLDVLLIPVGAGGLLAGCAIAAKHQNPAIKLIGVQAAESPSMVAALNAGRIVNVPIGQTLADGLEGNIEGGELTFSIIQRLVDDVVLVSESSIAAAMRLLVSDERLIVEGAGAVGVACLLEEAVDVSGQRAGLVLSGGNVSFETLRSILCA